MTPTKSRQNVDASLTTRGNRSLTLTPMSNPATASIPFRHLRALAASLALALAGCATPVLKPSLDVPDRFAAATAVRRRARGRVVGRLQGSGAFRPHPPRSAAEPRRQDRGRAATRRARRRDDQPLVAVSDRQPRRRRLRSQDELRLGSQKLRSRGGEYEGGADRRRCHVGSRPLRSLARGCRRGRGRHPGRRKQRARRASVGAERRRNELLHAQRGDPPARDGASDIRRARRNVATRNGTPTGRSRHVVRRRACADGSFEGTRGDTPARNARCRLAASHRRAHWRPGVQCREHHAVDRRANRSAGASGSTGRAVAAQARPARCKRAARRRQRPPATGHGRMVPSPYSRRRVRSREHRPQWHRPRPGAVHQRRGAAGDADLQRRTHAGDQRHRRERTTRSRPALRRRDRARIGRRREHARGAHR